MNEDLRQELEDQRQELHEIFRRVLIPQSLAGFAQARGMFAIPNNSLNTERAIVVRDARNAIIPYQPTPREIFSALFLYAASTSGATNLFIGSSVSMNCLLNAQPHAFKSNATSKDSAENSPSTPRMGFRPDIPDVD